MTAGTVPLREGTHDSQRVPYEEAARHPAGLNGLREALPSDAKYVVFRPI